MSDREPIAHFWAKHERLARKTDEQIPSPGYLWKRTVNVPFVINCFREKAVQLVDSLLPAFNTDSGKKKKQFVILKMCICFTYKIKGKHLSKVFILDTENISFLQRKKISINF